MAEQHEDIFEGLTLEQEEALRKAMDRESQNSQEERLSDLSPEERKSWGITAATASEQAKIDEQKNPSKS